MFFISRISATNRVYKIVFKDCSILKFDFNFDRLFLKEESLHVFFLIESDSFHGSFHVTMNMSNEYNFKQRFNFYWKSTDGGKCTVQRDISLSASIHVLTCLID